MVKGDRGTWKANYFLKLLRFVDEYNKILVVGVDNVGSKQMQQIRAALRHRAEILMGKNTMMRKAIRGHLDENPDLEQLLPHLRGNVGLVFTRDDLSEIKDLLLQNRVQAPAKAGAIAPIDVFVPAGPTTMGPEKTSFFQALSIPTKISRGTIEILSEVHLIHAGNKVGASEAALLNMLNVSPFQYGLELTQVYDNGVVYDPKVLDVTQQDLVNHFLAGIRNVAAISLAIGYPTVASVPHSIANGFKNLLAIALATEITFKQAEKAKEVVANPEKYAAAAVAAAPAPAAAAAKEEKKKEPSEKSEDEDMGFGLFD